MEQDGRMYAEDSLVHSPRTQFCIHKRVLQHFAELDLTPLFSLFFERLKSLWNRGLAAKVST